MNPASSPPGKGAPRPRSPTANTDKPPPPLMTIAVSSRALFDFEEENRIFAKGDETAYMEMQRERLEIIAAPGVAFPMIKKLLAFNGDGKNGRRLVEIIVLSRNDPTTGLRVFRAIGENGLDIQRGCFTRGAAALPYLSTFGAHLFLSAFADDVREALKNNFAAAHVMGGSGGTDDGDNDDCLRIAFDGDAVLFGDEAERVYQEKGLKQFTEQEREMADKPLQPGPLKPFFDALWNLRQQLPPGKIRTALITARGAPAHERPIRTLMDWGVEVDEAFFLAGGKKKKVLDSFRPDFYFDDQVSHLQQFTAAGHVDYGVVNANGD